MKYGHFDDDKREYVITTPNTPWPWINYLGCEDFFSLISNTAGGYCFYKDARYRRLTRYRYNNIPRDSNGRYFYINDGKDVWSPGWMPLQTELDKYECRHGMGYTKIVGQKNDVRAETLFFVPVGTNAEVHHVHLSNTGSAQKTITLFSYVEFCLYNALDDMTNFQRNFSTGEVEIDGSTIYHKTEYRERRNHVTFYSVNTPVTGFDTDLDTFIGAQGSLANPAVVLANKSKNSHADGWSPMASHSIEVTLAPNESKDFVFVLGYVENDNANKWESHGVIAKERSKKVQRQFMTVVDVNAAMAKLKTHWDDLLSRFQVKTPETRVDRMVNIWNQYQCMVTFNLSRSASYFEAGIGRGMGFRDSNQDILGFVHQVPASARGRLIDLASTQLEDGGAYHQYQPLTKKGNNEIGSNFNDDPLWLISAAAAYVKETGDTSLLDEMVPYDNDPQKATSFMEHLRRSFYHVVNNRGPHGLPLIGRADWNDCLNLNCFSTTPDESYQTTTCKDGKTAESVLIAGMFVFIGKEYVALCNYVGNKKEADTALDHITAMEKVVEQHGWDGEWYLRAYDDGGRKIGTAQDEEGKIFIESQGFCAMARIGADKNMPSKALASVKEHLATSHGIVLVDPAYTAYQPRLGEISSYPPGYKENGGIFCHNNPWVIIAEAINGNGNAALDYYSRIAPSFREEISDVHKMEPYVYSQMIAGKAAGRHGEAKNSWLTGTASWNFVTISQWILGVRADYNGLIVSPCIPTSWDGFSIKRVFRKCTYSISVENPEHVSCGVKQIYVDGVAITGDIIPIYKAGTEVSVKIVLGQKK